MNRIDQLFLDHPKRIAFACAYGGYLSEVLNELDTATIAEVIELFCTAREHGEHIFMGNGGSAATASYFANSAAREAGQRDGRTGELADIVVHIRTEEGEYGSVEVLHMVLDHLIGSFLFRLVRDERDHVVPSPETGAAE